MIEMYMVSASPKKRLLRNPIFLGMNSKTRQQVLNNNSACWLLVTKICPFVRPPLWHQYKETLVYSTVPLIWRRKRTSMWTEFSLTLFTFSHAHHAQIEHYTIIYRYLNTISEGRGAGLDYMSVLSKRWSAIALELSFFTILPRVFSLLDKEWMSSA